MALPIVMQSAIKVLGQHLQIRHYSFRLGENLPIEPLQDKIIPTPRAERHQEAVIDMTCAQLGQGEDFPRRPKRINRRPGFVL
jgi:hypothetical protein